MTRHTTPTEHPMTRHTASTVTDDALDALYAELDGARAAQTWLLLTVARLAAVADDGPDPDHLQAWAAEAAAS